MVPSSFDSRRQQLVERAWKAIDRDNLDTLLMELVDIPSPTGAEKPLALHISRRLRELGFDAEYQSIDSDRGNAIGWFGEDSGDGPQLLLFSPIDTPWTGSPEGDCGLTLEPRVDNLPKAIRMNEFIVGLGAGNPKCFVTSILAAAEAVTRAEVSLTGSLVLALAAGGMPVLGAAADGRVGHGVGCRQILERVHPDFAIVTKPGYAVAYEEAGMLWYRIRVSGDTAYTGTRHLLPYRSSIAGAARVVEALERYFPAYARNHTSGLIAPQGAVGAVVGGWPDRVSFVPAFADVYVDLRMNCIDSVEEVDQELDEVIEGLGLGHEGLEVHRERIVTFPGASTDPAEWIIKSTIRAWEMVARRPHVYRDQTSGTSEGNLLRQAAIPTARIGLPPVTAPPELGPFSMGVATSESMYSLVKLLCVAIVDSCTRTAEEVGLPRK